MAENEAVLRAGNDDDDPRKVWETFWQLVARMYPAEQPTEPNQQLRPGDPGE
jgi:hypothetical protein